MVSNVPLLYFIEKQCRNFILRKKIISSCIYHSRSLEKQFLLEEHMHFVARIKTAVFSKYFLYTFIPFTLKSVNEVTLLKNKQALGDNFLHYK